ncbi:MAG: hypothetical protein MJ064_08460 [Lachnospiraceae bacterium]|nr:hypothetical protein [Lachnospiraceae bacterium]
MKRNSVRGAIILVILIIVFSVVAFAVPFAKNTTFWCSYVFGIIAIMLQMYVFHVSFHNSNARSRFYGFPIARIGVLYLVAQISVSLCGMVITTLIARVPEWLFIVTNIIILAVFIIGCITVEVVRDEIVKQDATLKKSITTMRDMHAVITACVTQCDDEPAKRLLENLAEELRYSDPVTCEASADLEQNMSEIAKNIQKAVLESKVEDIGDFCKKMKGLLAERNRVCKVSK